MVANSLENVRDVLKKYHVVSVHAWLDSTVALYWIHNNNKEWKQFVSNRVKKINQKENITWRHCPTSDNPADIGSRGTYPLPRLWFDGPVWLSRKDDWPENITIPASEASNTEKRLTKEIHLTMNNTDEVLLANLLEKYSKLTKLLRVTAWIRRFSKNCKGAKISGELTPEEIQHARDFWILKTQADGQKMEKFGEISVRLNLVKNEKGILTCQGRISGDFPVFLPSPHRFTTMIIKDAPRRNKPWVSKFNNDKGQRRLLD